MIVKAVIHFWMHYGTHKYLCSRMNGLSLVLENLIQQPHERQKAVELLPQNCGGKFIVVYLHQDF